MNLVDAAAVYFFYTVLVTERCNVVKTAWGVRMRRTHV